MRGQTPSIEENLQEIFDRYFSNIQYHIRKYNPEMYGMQAEDLLQEVKIRLWKALAKNSKKQIYSAYVTQVVNSVIIDQIRRVRRHEKNINALKEDEMSGGGMEWSYALPNAVIAPAVEGLLQSRRRIVRLFLMDYSTREISELLNFSDKKVHNLLYRGLRDLKGALKK